MKNFHWVEILQQTEKPPEVEVPTLDEKSKRMEQARRDYSYITASFKEVAKKVTSQGRVGIRRTVRVVQDMVTHLAEDDEVYTEEIYEDFGSY